MIVPYIIICTLYVDKPPPPIIKETCEYDNISNLVVHNISWSVEFVTAYNYVKKILLSEVWDVVGGCTYPNGTIADQVMTIYNNSLL